ncbi:MAG: GntR family transcriptional regulator, partial [Actinomycetes bacterium]
MRTIRYQQIAENLRERLVAGNFAAGQMLPSESELSAEFSASRVTVRRALEVLRDEGLVNARQGFGWFVPGDTVRQPLGKLATIEEQM